VGGQSSDFLNRRRPSPVGVSVGDGDDFLADSRNLLTSREPKFLPIWRLSTAGKSEFETRNFFYFQQFPRRPGRPGKQFASGRGDGALVSNCRNDLPGGPNVQGAKRTTCRFLQINPLSAAVHCRRRFFGVANTNQ